MVGKFRVKTDGQKVLVEQNRMRFEQITSRERTRAPDGIDENWLKGVRLTFQKLDEVLSSAGVERIEATGSPFDPKLHEAVGSEETTEHPEDTVVAELRAGYRMHDRVLRPSLVRVARPPA